MEKNHEAELEALGLSPLEAEIYLTLVRHGGPMTASAIGRATGNSRSSVYLTLNSLTDIGIVEGGTGYASRFSAKPPQTAVSSLVARKNDELLRCKQIAGELASELELLAASTESDDLGVEMVQVLRDPRSVIEHYSRLQLEAEQQIDVFVKQPFFGAAGDRASNVAQKKAQQRGVRVRGLYEKAALEDPAIKPHFAGWIAAGEEARVCDVDLPHKMEIVDLRIVLMPLWTPDNQLRAVLIRNAQLAQSLNLAFDNLWQQSKPIAAPTTEPIFSGLTTTRRNGSPRLRRKKQPDV